NNSLNVKLSDEELAKLRENWTPKEQPELKGYLKRYRELVTSGNRGAVLEVPKR
ncbi:MAG: dihydroxy-acid dehydratase, partial [Lachnospiraceae bacterium]|nr:dihydroxy-acid dehydratase [Lachnospiraceae bacterium]